MARQNDLTTGKEYQRIFWFALPILIGNLFQQFYNMADSIIVGRVLGTQSLAAVGFCFQFNSILIALSMGLSLGMSILISRFLGAGEQEHIHKLINTGFRFMIFVSIAVLIAGMVLSQTFVALFQVPEDTMELAARYLRILFIGAVPLFLYNTTTNMLRGLGDSKRPVYFLATAAVINIALDLLFVKVLGFGIAGAAWATVLSEIFSFAGCLTSMLKHYSDYPIRPFRGNQDTQILYQALRIGIPSMVQQLMRSIGFLSLQGMVNSFGTAVMAAYTATQKIDSFALLPNLNLGQALSNFTAQNRGAGKTDRVNQGFKAALIMGWIITITISCVVIPLAPQIMGAFTDNPDVISIGIGYIRMVSIFYFVETAMQMLNGYLLGHEKGLMPFVSTLVSLILVQVPAAFLLSRFTPMAYTGIWLATSFGWGSGVAIRLVYYVRIRRA